MKKLKAWILLLIIGIIALSGMTITVQNNPAQAWVNGSGVEQGDKDSMYIKIAYPLFKACIFELRNFYDDDKFEDEEYMYAINASRLRGYEWFEDSHFSLATQAEDYDAGALMQIMLDEPKFDDQSVFCADHDQDNYLMQNFVDAPQYLNLGGVHEQIICDGANFLGFPAGTKNNCHETFIMSNGQFYFDTANTLGSALAWGPGQVFNNGLGNYINNAPSLLSRGLKAWNTNINTHGTREDYLDKIVKTVSFARYKGVPANSLFDMTPLEHYFLLSETMTYACHGNGNAFDQSQGGDEYVILVDDGQGGLTRKYFATLRNPDPDERIILRMIYPDETLEETTCRKIADVLNDETTPEMQAYKEFLESGAQASQSPNTAPLGNALCYTNADPLGFLICPIIEGIAGVGEALYEQVETDFLQVDPQYFKSDNGLEIAWGFFRDFANLAFIILFIIVIFSQLTGVGIDNYGIKKILPKIIVVAILVNLSFIICELAADVSNIVGYGIKNLFTGLVDQIQVEAEGSTLGESIAAAGVATGGAILFGLFSTGFVGFGIGAFAAVMGVLGAVISLAISMFFMYLVLMIRNAGIIILIAISPIAIVCYMLPNTETLFKKWLNLFKALLLVYPICGLLIGGGRLAAHILASNDNEMMKIAGMIVEVLPYFFIPKLLRQSLQLMGNIGARLSGLGRSVGRTASRGARQGIRNSGWYQNRMQDAKMNTLRRRAGIDEKTGELTARGQKKYERAAKKGGARFRRANARIAAARSGLDQGKGDKAEYMRLAAATGISKSKDINRELFGPDAPVDAGFTDGTLGAYYGRQMMDAAKAGDTESLDAAMAAAKAGGMKDKDIAKILRHIFKNGKDGMLNLSDEQRAAYARKLVAQHGNDILSKDLELKHHLQNGATQESSRHLAKLGDYFKHNGSIGDFKDEDWINADMNSIAAGLVSGKLNQDMAQRIMAKNPNVDPEKLVALGLIADGKVTGESLNEHIENNGGRVEDFSGYAKRAANNPDGDLDSGLLRDGERVDKQDISRYMKSRPQTVTLSDGEGNPLTPTNPNNGQNPASGESGGTPQEHPTPTRKGDRPVSPFKSKDNSASGESEDKDKSKDNSASGESGGTPQEHPTPTGNGDRPVSPLKVPPTDSQTPQETPRSNPS